MQTNQDPFQLFWFLFTKCIKGFVYIGCSNSTEGMLQVIFGSGPAEWTLLSRSINAPVVVRQPCGAGPQLPSMGSLSCIHRGLGSGPELHTFRQAPS